MKKEPETGKGMVIFDIDGVINSFSNRRFYYNFMRRSLKNLAKVRGYRELASRLPEIQKMGGPNALFTFAHKYCGSKKSFENFSRNLINDLDFDQIAHDPSLTEFIKRIGSYGQLAVRSDGISAIASAAWMRVVDDKPSNKIKEELLSSPELPSQTTQKIDGQNVLISGIDDNNMKTKTDVQSWLDFAKRNNCDLHKSVLLDDSRNNLKIAQQLGMTTVHISKLDSLLKTSMFGCGLSDILGHRMSDTLTHCKLTYGKEVDARTLFRVLLKRKNKVGKFNQYTAFNRGR